MRSRRQEHITPEAGQWIALYQDVHFYRLAELLGLVACLARARQCGIGTALDKGGQAAEGGSGDGAD